ncbi:hypothetical protein M5D96_000890 [Drosophila gunungcola]|uniref:Uncharacterized protein n=1 Tax=Drosophila gunungcola TaxID=103775 RepID=A0A9Q0BUX0_9MUSC|nr:hypothetical protein M5D96_000890 [Drosophila gunungcola]
MISKVFLIVRAVQRSRVSRISHAHQPTMMTNPWHGVQVHFCHSAENPRHHLPSSFWREKENTACLCFFNLKI